MREPTNWRIHRDLKRATRLAAGTLGIQDNELVERVMRLGFVALKEQEPKVRAVLDAAELP